MSDFIMNNKRKADFFCKQFEDIFKTRFMSYYNMLTGFDIIKFDESFLKTPDGKSTREVVEERYGATGVKIIEGLFIAAEG